jgi:DNA topoisomerase-3
VRFFSTPTAWISEDEKISIRKILGGRVMSEEEIVRLLQGETLGPYSDFRSKRGKQFTASVKLTKNKVEFLFAGSTDDLDIEQIKQGPSLGVSPLDSTQVYETPTGYMSESALDGDEKKGLKIGKIILSKEILPSHIQQLLSEGKTELIQGFISKKRRPFDAYLLLEKNGKISFDFPPRKQRKQA